MRAASVLQVGCKRTKPLWGRKRGYQRAVYVLQAGCKRAVSGAVPYMQAPSVLPACYPMQAPSVLQACCKRG